jgi:hypothetical protein
VEPQMDGCRPQLSQSHECVGQGDISNPTDQADVQLGAPARARLTTGGIVVGIVA